MAIIYLKNSRKSNVAEYLSKFIPLYLIIGIIAAGILGLIMLLLSLGILRILFGENNPFYLSMTKYLERLGNGISPYLILTGKIILIILFPLSIKWLYLRLFRLLRYLGYNYSVKSKVNRIKNKIDLKEISEDVRRWMNDLFSYPPYFRKNVLELNYLIKNLKYLVKNKSFKEIDELTEKIRSKYEKLKENKFERNKQEDKNLYIQRGGSPFQKQIIWEILQYNPRNYVRFYNLLKFLRQSIKMEKDNAFNITDEANMLIYLWALFRFTEKYRYNEHDFIKFIVTGDLKDDTGNNEYVGTNLQKLRDQFLTHTGNKVNVDLLLAVSFPYIQQKRRMTIGMLYLFYLLSDQEIKVQLEALEKATFVKEKIEGAIHNFELNGIVEFIESELKNAVFQNVEFREGVRFVKSNLTGANFVRTNFTPRASFEGSDLTGATFDNVTFGFVDFRDANLRNARFQKATFTEVNPTNCSFANMKEIDRESAESLRDAIEMWYQHAMASARDYWERTLIQKEYRRALGEIESRLKINPNRRLL